MPPGVDNEKLEELLIESNAAVACTTSLLTMLLEGKAILPDVQVLQRERSAAVDPPPEDAELIKLGNRLSKASQILQKKREKLH